MPSLALAKSRVLANVAGLTTTFFDLVREDLFGNGEQGIYMPSVHESFLRGDLYQNAAGTTPVTAAGQPVGLWLDRSKGGAGPELIANGGFSDGATGWELGTAWTVAGGKATTPGGDYIRQVILITPGSLYEVSLVISDITSSGNLRIRLGGNTDQINAGVASYGVGKHTFRLRAEAGDSWVSIGGSSTAGYSATNISVRELPGNHASQPTAASRPALQQDANGMYVLRFDGDDDWMVTPSIDFTGTDKMTVLAGVRKLRETSRGAVLDAGDGGPNAFYLTAPNHENGFHSYGFGAGASLVTSVTMSGHPAPDLAVLSGSGDIALSGAGLVLRRNGELGGAAVATGPGAYGNHPITLGRRLGGAIPYYGDIYGLIVCGAEKSLAQIERGEALINRYTRAY